MAAMVAYEFKIDPVLVLKADYFDWSLRMAAVRHIQEQREKEARKMKSKSKK